MELHNIYVDVRNTNHLIIESFRFQDEDNYEYEIFLILSSACVWTNVILMGKHDSRRNSTASFRENVLVTLLEV